MKNAATHAVSNIIASGLFTRRCFCLAAYTYFEEQNAAIRISLNFIRTFELRVDLAKEKKTESNILLKFQSLIRSRENTFFLRDACDKTRPPASVDVDSHVPLKDSA